MAMNRSNWPKDLELGLNAHFGMAYKEKPDEWTAYMDIENSSKAFEEDVLEVGFGNAVVKPEGGEFTLDEGGQGWTARYHHNTIGLAFAMTQEALEDNLYGSLSAKYAKALARSLKNAKEIRCANLLNYATTGTHKGGDGVSLLSETHPLYNGGTASNTLSTSSDLTESALEDILVSIANCVDDRGIPIGLRAVKLVIPPQLQFVAKRILGSDKQSGTANNDINAVKHVFNNEPAIVTRLSDTSAWFVKTDAPDGLKLFQRKKITRGTTEDYKTGNMIYMAHERYSEGWTDWRAIFGSM